MHRTLSLLAVLAVCTPAFAANMLLNGSFQLPDESPTPEACPTGGWHAKPTNWTVHPNPAFNNSGDPLFRNGSVHMPNCPSPDATMTFGFWSNGGGGQKIMYYQEVTLAQPAQGEAYKFKGYFAGGAGGLPLSMRFGIRAGDHTGITALPAGNNEAVAFKYIQPSTPVYNWPDFIVTLTPPAGTATLTVYFYVINGGSGFNAFWADGYDLDLAGECVNQPDISGIAPEAIVADGVTTHTLTLTGSNFGFAPPQPPYVCKLREPELGPEHLASAIRVISSTTVEADFVMPTNAPFGLYDLLYNQDNCDQVSVNSGVLVYLPALRNGDFELPGAAEPCTAEATHPDDFIIAQGTSTDGWSGMFNMNGYSSEGTLPFTPTCPRGGEGNYASMTENDDDGDALAYQTVAALPSTQYTVSGLFAASGNTRSYIYLREGDIDGNTLATINITTGASLFDWQFKYAAGTTSPTAEMVTIEWYINGPNDNVNGMRGVHADNLALEVCDDPTPPLVTGIDPPTGVNDETVPALLHGSNLDGTEQAFLMGPGVVIEGAIGDLVGADLEVEFDLSALPAPSGTYDVLVKKGGCISSAAGVFKVAAVELMNGHFDDPPAGEACLPNYGRIPGTPTGWNSNAPSAGLFRDGEAPRATACPSPDGGHHGSFSEGSGGTVQAWQTIKTVAGHEYKFSGYFDAPTEGTGLTVTLRLINGYGTGGTQLASNPINASTGWAAGEVTGTALSAATTVVWQMTLPGGDFPGGHADGLKVEDMSGCYDPFADFDGDTDVDAEDWGFMQACITGDAGTVPDGCTCANKAVETPGIGQADINLFELCASGPNVAADPACDGVD